RLGGRPPVRVWFARAKCNRRAGFTGCCERGWGGGRERGAVCGDFGAVRDVGDDGAGRSAVFFEVLVVRRWVDGACGERGALGVHDRPRARRVSGWSLFVEGEAAA